jgi:hypothetical protein
MAQHMRMYVAEAGLYAKPSKQPASRSSAYRPFVGEWVCQFVW